MGRPKGGKNRYWSKEEKLRIIKKIINEGYSTKEVAKQESVSDSMIRKWIKRYVEQGEDALQNQKKPGNPLSKFSNKKNLTDMEKLEYENMKLRIENERLKKGYKMEGDGSIVIYK